jgi:uncharacterized protein (DUF2267 family)
VGGRCLSGADGESESTRHHGKELEKRGAGMTNTGYSSFDTTVHKTNRILRQIEESCGWPKERRNQSYNALRAVLHALRDRLTVDEAAHFSAQLPMLVRGIYYDGWDPSRVPKKMHREDFLEQIQKEMPPYEVKGGIEMLVYTVAQALRLYITDGEWRDIKSEMPKDLATFLP